MHEAIEIARSKSVASVHIDYLPITIATVPLLDDLAELTSFNLS